MKLYLNTMHIYFLIQLIIEKLFVDYVKGNTKFSIENIHFSIRSL